MCNLLKLMLNNWVDFSIISLTIVGGWMLFIAGIRVFIETSIPTMFEKCVKAYFTYKSSSALVLEKKMKEIDNEN